MADHDLGDYEEFLHDDELEMSLTQSIKASTPTNLSVFTEDLDSVPFNQHTLTLKTYSKPLLNTSKKKMLDRNVDLNQFSYLSRSG